MASVKCILAEQGGKGGGAAAQVSKIEVTNPPTKTTYLAGDTFDPTGLVVRAYYTLDGIPLSEADVQGTCTFSPSPLTDGTTTVTISYTDGNGVTVTTTQAVTIIHKLVSIAVTTQPTKVSYEYGDTLNTTGLVVTATYSDGASAAITPTSCSPTALNTVGTQAITVTYTENSVTKTTSFNVTVERKTIPVPTWKGTLTYNKSQQSADNTSLWNNYTSNMTIGSTLPGTAIVGTNAGSYNASFTPKANYRWPDGTTTAKSVAWSIAKAAGKVTLNPSTVAINASNYSSGVQVAVTRDGTGAVSCSNVPSGITCSISGTTITVKGNGSTAVNATNITVTAAADTNYNAATATFSVSAVYWSWGSETGNADAAWWSGLKGWIKNASISELSACVGKTKSVTLSTAVLGTTTHLVRCIGYNCNRDKNDTTRNTLTFETANGMAQTTVFGTSNGKWTGSTVRQQCINYYNAFPGKASVSTVSIGTATDTNSNQNGTPTYTDETVFLASDAEHGFPKGADYSNGKGYAASYDEFDKYNTAKTPYQYCTSNANRIKKQGDNGSANYYWERSLRYDVASGACRVLSDGKPTSCSYYNSNMLAPAFVI